MALKKNMRKVVGQKRRSHQESTRVRLRTKLQAALILGALVLVALSFKLSSPSHDPVLSVAPQEQRSGLRDARFHLDVSHKEPASEEHEDQKEQPTDSEVSKASESIHHTSVNSVSLPLSSNLRSRSYGHLLYFAYASDLLLQRLISGGTSSAVKVTIAYAPDLAFDYSIYSAVWKGKFVCTYVCICFSI
jgi:hypothetical protein